MDPIDLLKKITASSDVDHYEIYWEEKRKQSFQSKEGRVEQIEESFEKGIALRLFQDGKKAFSSTSDLSESGLKKAVDLALESLPLLGRDAEFTMPRQRARVSLIPSHRPTRDEKISAVLNLEKSARDFDARISKVRDVRVEEEEKKIILVNSEGSEHYFEDTVYEMSLMVVADTGIHQEMAWESDFKHEFTSLVPEGLGRAVAEKAIALLDAQNLPTKKTAVLLDSLVVSAFLNVLAQSFCADQVHKGRSYLKNRLGSHVYAAAINIVEDPLSAVSYDRCPFDAEGTSSQKTPLVEKGVVKSLLTDLQMAQALNLAPTGHAVRSSYKEAPHISPRRFALLPGRFSTEELIEEMGKGFYVQDVIGAHTMDAVSGDFSLGATGLWIDKGKRRGAVRGVTISGNLHDILRKVDKVGSLIREYPSFGAASLLISSMDVAGS